MTEVNRSTSAPVNSPISVGRDEPSGSKKLNISNREGHHDQLYTSLKAVVSKVASQLRRSILDQVLDPDPISYRLPESNAGINASTFPTTPSSSVEVKSRRKTTLLGQETVSFFLPPDCIIGTDLDKNLQCQSSFNERLRGWTIACKRRANGKLDMNYCHDKSTRMFRSTVEVVEYILEAIIHMDTPGADILQGRSASSSMNCPSKRKTSSSKNEKTPPSKSSEISTAEEIDVARFLEESYHNLHNIRDGKWATQENEEWEKYLKANNESEDDASGDEET